MQNRLGRRVGAAGVLVVTCALVSGCSAASSEESAAGDIALGFYAAVQAQQWDQACALLMPSTVDELQMNAQTECSTALPDENLPHAGQVQLSEVWGTLAQVRLDGDVVFLASTGGGWRITAAGCTFRAENVPYSCDLKGG